MYTVQAWAAVKGMSLKQLNGLKKRTLHSGPCLYSIWESGIGYKFDNVGLEYVIILRKSKS